MAIAKKPNSNTSEIVSQKDHKAEAFIAGAAHGPKNRLRPYKQPILIRFNPNLLDKIDEASRHRGISRSAWIQYIISKALDYGEG
jgi:hypothetical protein